MLGEKSSEKEEKSGQGRNLSYMEGFPEMARTPDVEETLRKIDEDLDFNPANVVAAPTPLKKIVSFEKPPARDCKSTTKVAQVAKPNGKAHITEPISLPKTTENAKAIKKSKVGAVPKPKEQGTWVRYTRVTKATNQFPAALLAEENRNPSHSSDPRPSKCQNISKDVVLCQIPAAVADVHPRRTP